MKRPELLVLVVVWMFLSAATAIIGILAIAIFAFPDTPDVAGIFGLSIAEATLTCYVGLSVAGGIGLMAGKEWGRILAIVNAVLSLFAFPIGTAVGILVMIYLLRSEVRQYFSSSQS